MDNTEDIFFVKRIPFLITLGQKVKFTTVENIADWKAKTLLKGLSNTASLYKKITRIYSYSFHGQLF